MKALTMLITLLVLSTTAFSQEITTQKAEGKITKAQKKHDQEAKDAQQFDQKTALFNSKRFVLEVDYIINRSGDKFSVSSPINFILVDSIQAVVQTGQNSGVGANGVGGLTALGKITYWKMERNQKKRSINLQFNTLTDNGFLTVFINTGRSGRTTATVSGNYSFDNLTFDGKLVPIDESVVYKGRSLFRQ